MNKIPLKIGVQLDSPAIVYVYKESGSLRMRRMPVRNFWANTDIEFVLEDIRNRHGEHIADIPDRALRKMLNIVKQHKQGKSLEQIIGATSGTKKMSGETTLDTNEIVFNKLKSNIRGGTNTTDSLKEKLEDNTGREGVNFKKKEFPQRTTFATLYESGNENNKNKVNENNRNKSNENKAEAKGDSSNSSFLNKRNTRNDESTENMDSSTKRPTTLELNNFELSTSFNTYVPPQERKIRPLKTGFLQDLEKDLAGIEFPEKDKKDDNPHRLIAKKTSLEEGKKEKEVNRSNNMANHAKVEVSSRSKNEDDTDVEFDESDNPLDDPEEDFW